MVTWSYYKGLIKHLQVKISSRGWQKDETADVSPGSILEIHWRLHDGMMNILSIGSGYASTAMNASSNVADALMPRRGWT